MHPIRAERARSLHRLVGASVLFFALGAVAVLGGCSGGSDSPETPQAAQAGGDRRPAVFAPARSIGDPEAAERDSALAVLTSMQRAVFDSAFVRLADRSYTRRLRTEQIDPATGTTTARREQTVRRDEGTGAATVVATADSGAAFKSGPLDTFVPASDPTEVPQNLAESAFPDDPAYLSERTRESFRYRLRPATVDGRSAWTIRIQARPEQGADQSIRYAELIVLRDSRELVAASTIRSENVLLFREESRMAIRLQPESDGTWLPAETRFHARIDIPFREPLEFRTVSTYRYAVL
jgi:hypothetical protein